MQSITEINQLTNQNPQQIKTLLLVKSTVNGSHKLVAVV
uniref:Uncharacterized protein n=1 Tax=Anguilla anguilla TaxID=7936 RepID=A0A0E9UKM6_ANGAN